MQTRLLSLIFFALVSNQIKSQTLPAAQTLPYTQNFGTSTFSSFPVGLQGWNGLSGGSISSQALAEASTPTGNATVSVATASTTTGAIYGYCSGGTNCGNGRLYVQGSSNATNGVNQFCVAIKSGGFTSLTLSYTVEVVNAGSSATQGRVVQYRDSTSSTWTTIPASVASYTPGTTTNGGDADNAGDVDTFSMTVSGLTTNRTYYFRWAHWRTSGTSVGTAYDNISFAGGCTPPTTTASNISFPILNPTQATIKFNRGNGDTSIVLLKAGSSVNGSPSSGTYYQAQSNFGSGAQIGTGNYVVGKTKDSTVNITGLTENTYYYYGIFEFKTTNYCYASTSTSGFFRTPCNAPTAQAAFGTISPATNTATIVMTAGTGGSGRLVKLNNSLSFTNPTDATHYSANNTYGGSGEQIVYSASGTSFSVSGLASNTKYYIKIFEYNCDSSQRKYLTTSVVDSFTTNLPSSSESDIIAISGSESSTISSIVNSTAPLTIANSASMWTLQLRDGGADTLDSDTFPTKVNTITFLQSVGNAINDWADAIESIALFKDSIRVANGTVNATSIVFNGFPLMQAEDNAVSNYTIRVTLQSNPNNSGSNIDGDDFGLSLSAANILLAAGSSQKDPALSALISANDSNRMAVVATKFTIRQQPSNTGKGAIMSPAVIIAATDMHGNTDIDFSDSIAITSTGNLSGSPMYAIASNGISTFSNIIHNVAENKRVLLINRKDTINWQVVSDSFNITPVTTFNFGDLVLVGYDNNVPAGDKLIVMNTVDILPGTKFCLINACYDLLNATGVRSNRWFDSDGSSPLTDSIYSHEITWNGSTSIAKGSILCISVPSIGTSYSISINGVDSTAKFLISDNGKGGSSPNMSTSNPDAIFIGQGSWNYYNSYATFDGKILYGLISGGTWYQFSDDVSSVAQTERRSRVHPHTECLKLQGKSTSGNAYAYYTGSRSGSRKTILTNIADPTKWTIATGNSSDDLTSVYPCTNTFTINTTYRDTNYWFGNVSSNWFDCNNWESLAVPDSATNVMIRDTAALSIDIENSSTSADKYGSIAYCKNLVVDSLRTLTLNDNFDYLQIYGHVYLKNGSSLSLQSGSGGNISLKGSIFNYSTTDNISEFNSTLVFTGEGAQTYTTANPSGDNWHQVQVNKGNQKYLQLNGNLTAQHLTLTNGIIQTNGFTLTVNGIVAGYESVNDSGDYTNNNYIIGKLRRNITTNGNYFFPIGDSINGEGYNPVNLNVTSGTGYATAEFTPGDPGDCAMPVPLIFYCGTSTQYMAKYDDMTGEGMWKFTGNIFSYNIDAYPNKLNVNTKPNKNQAPSYSATYRLLKAPIGTTDWTPYVLLGDSCSVSNNYYHLVGAGYTGFSQFAPGGSSGLGTALPVQLLSFKGRWKTNSTALFEWVTASEWNNQHFELQSSEDGKQFETIATIAGAGNSERMLFYSKEVPVNTSAYFRLKQVDEDNSFTFSKTIKLNMNTTIKSHFSIEQNTLKVEMPELAEVRIYNVTGALIVQSNQAEVALHQLPSNLYILQLTSKTGVTENYKFYK